jgi:hypothetical protein
MGIDIDKILEEYYQKQIDLLEVRKQLLLLYNTKLSLLDKVKDIAFGDGSDQERIVNIRNLFGNEA